MRFSYTVEKNDKTVTFCFEGRILDRSEADQLMGEYEALIKTGSQDFLIDLSKIDYMNSSGLNVLISLLNMNRDHYGKLIIFGVPATVESILKTSKLFNLFTICATKEEAIKKLAE